MSKTESLHEAIQDNKIVIMTIPNCSYCIKAKEFLKKKKKAFKELLYTSELDEEFWKKYKKKYPFVPRIMIDQEFIGGFLELKDYKKEKPEKEDKAKGKEKCKRKKKMTNIGRPNKKKKINTNNKPNKKDKLEEFKLEG